MLIPLCFINTANGARWSFIGSHPLPYALCILNKPGRVQAGFLFVLEGIDAGFRVLIHPSSIWR